MVESTIATVLGGLILTFIIFILNEKIFPKKNLTGEWIATLKHKESSYNPYKGLQIIYQIHLLQMGNEIIGSGEKIKEIRSSGEEYEFEFDKRVTISLKGYFERKFLSNSRVSFNVTEDGRVRESRATFLLEIQNENLLKGKFLSTAANSKGDIVIRRETM